MNKSKFLLVITMVYAISNMESCSKTLNKNMGKIQDDSNSELNRLLQTKDYEKAIEYLRISKAYDFVINDHPLLSYCVENNLTQMTLEILSNLSSEQINSSNEVSFLFETVLCNGNIILEKAFLEKGIDVSYRNTKRGNATFLDICLKLEKNASLKKEMILMLLSYDYVRKYYANDSSALYSVIYNWDNESSIYLDLIYGERLSEHIQSCPVIYLSINNINAIKYFIEHGANAKSYMYFEECDFTGTPLEYAIFLRNRYINSAEDENEIRKMDDIILYLEQETSDVRLEK